MFRRLASRGPVKAAAFAGGVALSAYVLNSAPIKAAEEPSIFVINGFYMAMREKYTKPGTSIYYYLVEWDPAKLSWEDFRGKVLGATDPTTAADSSLRRAIYSDWKKLGLASEPNVGDNGERPRRRRPTTPPEPQPQPRPSPKPNAATSATSIALIRVLASAPPLPPPPPPPPPSPSRIPPRPPPRPSTPPPSIILRYAPPCNAPCNASRHNPHPHPHLHPHPHSQ